MSGSSIHDCDYFLSTEGIAYIVKGNRHPAGTVRAIPVYWPDSRGNRIHLQRGSYRKEVDELNREIFVVHPEYRPSAVPRTFPLIPRVEVDEIFRPRQAFVRFMEEEGNTVWRQLAEALVDSGIPASDIGIFGSYLVGLHRNRSGKQIKDIDFVVYGQDNRHRLRSCFTSLQASLGCDPISPDHVRYQAKKYSRILSPVFNSWEQMLANKWSSIQVAPGLLSTIRFAYRPEETPYDPVASPIIGPVRLDGLVDGDEGTDFIPRTFRLRTIGGDFSIFSWFWAYQSCVRNGNRVRVVGNLHADGWTVSLDQFDHGIRVL